MTAQLTPTPVQKFWDNNGAPASGAMTFFIATVSGTKVSYNSNAFTNTGSKGLGGITFTYDLGN